MISDGWGTLTHFPCCWMHGEDGAGEIVVWSASNPYPSPLSSSLSW